MKSRLNRTVVLISPTNPPGKLQIGRGGQMKAATHIDKALSSERLRMENWGKFVAAKRLDATKVLDERGLYCVVHQ